MSARVPVTLIGRRGDAVDTTLEFLDRIETHARMTVLTQATVREVRGAMAVALVHSFLATV